MVRPLFWDDPQDERLWDVDDAYLLGSSVLVAPVVEPGATSRSVSLPERDWYDFWTDELYSGGKEINIDAPLERIPLMVRAGSILPLVEDECLTLHVYLPPADAKDAESRHYADCGEGYGSSRLDNFNLTKDDKIVYIKWQREGNYLLPNEVALRVHGGQPVRYTLNRNLYEWEADTIKIQPFEKIRFELK